MHEKCSILRGNEHLTHSFSRKSCKVDSNCEIILKWVLKEVMRAWTEFTLLRIVTSKHLFSVKGG